MKKLLFALLAATLLLTGCSKDEVFISEAENTDGQSPALITRQAEVQTYQIITYYRGYDYEIGEYCRFQLRSYDVLQEEIAIYAHLIDGINQIIWSGYITPYSNDSPSLATYINVDLGFFRYDFGYYARIPLRWEVFLVMNKDHSKVLDRYKIDLDDIRVGPYGSPSYD